MNRDRRPTTPDRSLSDHLLGKYGTVLTVEQLSEALGCGRGTAYDLVYTGQVEAFQVSATGGRARGAIRITKRSVEAYLERQRLGPRR